MGDLQPVNMKLYMVDGSCVQPTGIIEDVPVQVGKFFVSNDFVVIDIDADVDAGISAIARSRQQINEQNKKA